MSIKKFINKFYAFASYTVLIIGIYLIFLFNGQDDSGNYGVDAIVLSVIWIVLWYILNKRLHNFKWINANLNTQNAEIKAVLTKNKKLFTVIFTLLKFLILLLGFHFIWNLDPGFGAIILSPIWLFIWYMAIMTEWIITDKGKMSSSSKIAALLPIISLIIIVIWFTLQSLFHKYKTIQIENNNEALHNYIIEGKSENAIKIIESNQFYNFPVLIADSSKSTILIEAAKHDEIIFNSLVNEFKGRYGINIRSTNDINDNCIFYYLKKENTALLTIDKISDFGFGDYYSTSYQKGYCNNKDLLIYFIENGWTKCIDKYLTKYFATKFYARGKHFGSYYYKKYNCQIKIRDTLETYPKHIIVSPYSFTNDSAVISCLQKYSFAEADSNAIEICDSLSIVTINTQTEN